MNIEFSKATIGKALERASANRHTEIVKLLQEHHKFADEKLIDAAASGDLPTVRKLLGVAPEIGSEMQDGTIYAGISPDTCKPMYVMPTDACLTVKSHLFPGRKKVSAMKWEAAIEYAADYKGPGTPKGTFRVPTKEELNVLFHNNAKIGGFNKTGWYWSSTEKNGDAYHQRFGDGFRNSYGKGIPASVRLVRS